MVRGTGGDEHGAGKGMEALHAQGDAGTVLDHRGGLWQLAEQQYL
jgi:hypothetical protein